MILKEKTDILQFSAKTLTSSIELHQWASKQILKSIKMRYCTSFNVNYIQRYDQKCCRLFFQKSAIVIVFINLFIKIFKNLRKKIARQIILSLWKVQNMQYLPLGLGLLYIWTDTLGTFFATFVIMKIYRNNSNTICTSSKNITSPKIWRMWLKNWAHHAHFNFELLKGVAVLFSELCPSNFGQS